MIGTAAGILTVYLLATDQMTWGRFAAIVLASLVFQALLARAERRLNRPSSLDRALTDNEKLRERVGELEGIIYAQESQLEDLREETKEIGKTPYPAGTTLVKITTLTELRNILLKHHNGRSTDKSYCESGFAKQTNDTVAVLNVFLDKKKGRLR